MRSRTGATVGGADSAETGAPKDPRRTSTSKGPRSTAGAAVMGSTWRSNASSNVSGSPPAAPPPTGVRPAMHPAAEATRAAPIAFATQTEQSLSDRTKMWGTSFLYPQEAWIRREARGGSTGPYDDHDDCVFRVR